MPTRHTHEHEIVYDSTTERLDLVKDDQNRAMYRVIEEVPNYQNPLEFVQDNWIGGHGQHTFEEPDMFYEGENIETGLDGMLYLGPLLSNPTSYYSLADAAVADDGGVQTTETTGTRDSTANDMTLLPATPAVNDAYYFGSAVTYNRVRLNVGTRGVGTWTITWEYWNGSAWTALSGVDDETVGFTSTITSPKNITFTVPGDWATTTVNSIASMYWVRARVSAYTSVTTQPKGTQAWTRPVTATLGEPPVVIMRYSAISLEMVATTTMIWKYDATDIYEMVEFSGETITDMKEYDGVLYVAIGSSASAFWYYSTDGLAYTQTDLTNAQAQKFLVSPNPAGTATVLWSAKQPNELYNTTNGKTAAAGGQALSSVAYIGDTSNNITTPFLSNDNLMVGREDGLFHYDADGGVHPLMQVLRESRSTNNFKYVASWQGSTYCSVSTGLTEITSYNTVDSVDPLVNAQDIRKLSDNIVGLATDINWIYVAIDEGTNTHIYKGHEVLRGDKLRWEWDPWITLSTNACATMAILQRLTIVKRLWFGYGNDIRWVPVYDIPYPSSVFCSAGWVRMSYTYGTNPFWDKLFQSVVLETEDCAAGKTVTIKYRKDTDTTATACTADLTSNGINETKLTSALNCNRIQFEIHLATDDSSTTPKVKSFKASGIEKPEVVRIHECYYSIGDEPSNRAKTIRTALRTARASTSLVKFADLRYNDDTATTSYVWVTMQPGYPQEVEVAHERSRAPELAVLVRWQEVDFTIS